MAQFPSLWSRNELGNPVRAITRMQRQMDRLFDDLMNTGFSSESQGLPLTSEAVIQPPCDIQETDSHFVLSFEVPGMSKNDLKIELQDNTLTVHGERKDESDRVKGATRRTERYYGVLERTITLPSNIKADAIETHFENGVLHVAVPKMEIAKPKLIPINEGKPGFLQKLIGKKEEKAA